MSQTTDHHERRDASRARALAGWIELLVLVAIAFGTNPSLDRHREAVATYAIAQVEAERGEALSGRLEAETSAGKVVGTALAHAFVRAVTAQIVSSDDYHLFSLTRVTLEGQEKIVGVGAFGCVVMIDDVKNRVERLTEQIRVASR